MTALVHKRVEAGRMLRLSILPLLTILGGLLPQLTTSVPGRVEGMVVELGSGLLLADVWVTLGSDGNDRDILTDWQAASSSRTSRRDRMRSRPS